MDSLLTTSLASLHLAKPLDHSQEKNREKNVKVEGAGEAFAKSVRPVQPETYTHIELAAGNYRFNTDNTYSSRLPTETILPHEDQCDCIGCDYVENRYRYTVLEKTIEDTIHKHSDKRIRFYINDYDPISNNQAVKHARQHVLKTFPNANIEFIEMTGDFFEIEFDQHNPDAVHLKNPDKYFLAKLDEGGQPDFNAPLRIDLMKKLLGRCTECEEEGLILVLSKLTNDRLEPQLRQSEEISVEKYSLGYSAAYHHPPNNLPTTKYGVYLYSFIPEAVYVCRLPGHANESTTRKSANEPCKCQASSGAN